MNDYYSISDIAKACGISRQAVYKRLGTDDNLAKAFDDAAQMVDGRKVYTVDALKALQNVTCKTAVNQVVKDLQGEAAQLTAERDNLQRECDNLRAEVDRLTVQLKSTENTMQNERESHLKSIESLTAEVDRLTAALDSVNQSAQNKVDELHEKHAEQLERMSTSFVRQLTETVDKLNASHSEQLEQLRIQLTNAQQLTSEAHALQAGQLQKDSAQLVTVADDHKPTLWQRLFKHKQ